jgi:hypothetical protein
MPNDIHIFNVREASVSADFAKNGRGRGVTILCSLSIAGFLLSGCALPVPIQAASWAIDGISYLATNKSLMDHGISAVRGQDCATFRIVTDGNVCRPNSPIALDPALSPDLAPAPIPDPDLVVYTEVSEIPPPIDLADALDREVQ